MLHVPPLPPPATAEAAEAAEAAAPLPDPKHVNNKHVHRFFLCVCVCVSLQRDPPRECNRSVHRLCYVAPIVLSVAGDGDGSPCGGRDHVAAVVGRCELRLHTPASGLYNYL